MLGLGEAFLPPFAIALGAGSVVVGLLGSLPLFVGSLFQLLSVQILGRFASRKLLVLGPALAQACVWAPLFALPLVFPGAGPVILLLCAVVYFALGHFGLPPWNSWIGDLVPPDRRGAYFGRRDRLRTFCQLAALLSGGAILAVSERFDLAVVGFGALFALAGAARLTSAWFLWRTDELAYVHPREARGPSLAGFLARLGRDGFGRFALYVACVQFATQLAGPFFALYMLRDLGFSYLQFTVASAVCILSQAVAFHNWGKVGDQFGNLAVLRATGLCLPFVPLLWLISPRFEAVVVYQIISGFAWAGFNLSAANFLFDMVPPPSRPRAVAHYNFLSNAGIIGGAALGGGLAPLLPDAIRIGALELPLASPLQLLFLISGLTRLALTIVFVPLLREVRPVETPSTWRVFVRVVGMQPIRGLRFSVFNGVHPKEEKEAPADEPPLAGGTAERGE